MNTKLNSTPLKCKFYLFLHKSRISKELYPCKLNYYINEKTAYNV